MTVTCVLVHIKKEYIDDFIEASLNNHKQSVKEPGNMRFDILQQVEDPARFTLYEAYESQEAAAAHKETTHYKQWRKSVEHMMEEPRHSVTHRVLAPAIRDKW